MYEKLTNRPNILRDICSKISRILQDNCFSIFGEGERGVRAHPYIPRLLRLSKNANYRVSPLGEPDKMS